MVTRRRRDQRARLARRSDRTAREIKNEEIARRFTKRIAKAFGVPMRLLVTSSPQPLGIMHQLWHDALPPFTYQYELKEPAIGRRGPDPHRVWFDEVVELPPFQPEPFHLSEYRGEWPVTNEALMAEIQEAADRYRNEVWSRLFHPVLPEPLIRLSDVREY